MNATAITELLPAPSVDELELATFSVGDDPAAEARLAVPISAATGVAEHARVPRGRPRASRSRSTRTPPRRCSSSWRARAS